MSGNDGLEASEIKNIINGTYTGSTDSDTVLDFLYGDPSDTTSTGVETDTAITNTYFTLNPEAGPTFNVAGFSITKDKYENASNASLDYTLTVQTVAGEDGTYFYPNSFTVYIFGPYDSVPDYLDDLYENPENYDGIVADDGTEDTYNDAIQIASNSDYSGSSVESYNYAVTIDPDDGGIIVSDKYYFIVETGEDKNGIEIEPSGDYYGFIGTVSGNPPTITVTSPEDLSVVNSGEKTFTGTVTTETEGISSVAYSISVTDENASDTSTLYTISGDAVLTGSSNPYAWSFDVRDGEEYTEVSEGEQYLYTATITAEDNNGNTSKTTSRVHIDTTDPVVSISSVTPTVTRTSDSEVCVNGEVTVSGKITETNLASVTLTVSDNADTPKTNVYDLGAVYSFDKSIDTTEYTDGQTLTFTLSATDEGGNTSSEEISYTIDQSTDNPVVSLSNADSSIDDSDDIDTSSNLFGTVSNNKILGTISDDDGIASYKIGYRTYNALNFDEDDSNDVGSYTYEDGNSDSSEVTLTAKPTTKSISYVLPATEGTYDIKIAVTDSVDTTAEYNTTTSAFVVGVDSGAPSFTNVTPTDGNFYSSSIPITGTLTDASGVVSLVAKITNDSSTETSVAGSDSHYLTETEISGDVTAGASWSDDSDVPDATGDYTITYTATDKYGQESSYAISYVVDKTAPTVTVADLTNPYIKKEDKYKFSGTIKDNDRGSGEDGVIYTIGSGDDELTGDATITGTAWYVYVDVSTLSGEQTISFIGSDVAENEAEAIYKTIYIDDAAPTTTIYSNDTDTSTTSGLYTSDGTEITDTDVSDNVVWGSSYLAKEAFTLKGTITETYLDTATLTVTKDGSAVDGATFTTGGDSSGTAVEGDWTYEQDANSDGTNDGLYVYTISITDKAGREYEKSISVRVDTTAPVLSVTYPGSGESTDSSTYTLKGTVIDAGSGGVTVTYQLNSEDAVNAELTGSTWTAENVDLGSTEGTIVLKVNAQDKLGNVAEEEEITFYYDKAAPTLTETAIGVSGLTTNTSFTLSGTATDSNGLTSVIITDDSSDDTWSFLTSDSTLGASPASWTQAITPADDGTHVYTITLTDAANKTATKTRTVTLDTNAPSMTIIDFEDAVEGTYYGSTQVGLEITTKDMDSTNSIAGSGVSSVSYSTDYDTDTETGNWVSLTKGDSTWTGYVSCSTEGDNSVYLKATDAAGNEAISTEYILKVDTTAPTCELTSVDGNSTTPSATKLVNGEESVIVKGTADDSASGISSVKIKVNSNDFTSPDVTVTDFTSDTWTAEIPTDKLASGTVWAQAIDKAGNSFTVNLFTLQLDAEDPSISVTSIADADSDTEGTQVNGTISINGTASDDQTLSTVTLQYESGADVWTDLGTITGTYSWETTDIDTSSLSYDCDSSTDGTQVCIKATATDAAGNTASDDIIITVDQDTDRPIIKISNLQLADMTSSNYVWLEQTSTLYGTVTDDDGVDSLIIKYKYKDSSDYTTATVSVSGSSWNYTLPEGDGSYLLTFVVTDDDGTVFTSSTEASTTSVPTPKISDTEDIPNTFGYTDSSSVNTNVYVKVDTNQPILSTQGLSSDNGTTWNTAYNELTLGGSDIPSIELRVTASDANGIADVSASVSGLVDSDGSDVDDATYSATEETIDDVDYYVFDSIDCSDGSGYMTITITATDNAGLTATTSLSVQVDNTSPEITIITPSSTINSEETIRGSVDETVTLYYAVSTESSGSPSVTSDQIDALVTTDTDVGSTAWEEILASSLSWSIYFDGDSSTTTETHTDLLKYYISTLGITTEENIDADSDDSNQYDTITTLYLWIKAVDENGNSSYEYEELTIDPQGDRPTVSLSYPDNGAVLGGSIRLIGSVDDNNNDAEYAWVQIDSDNDGTFDSDDIAVLKNYTDDYTLGNMTTNTAYTSTELSGTLEPDNTAIMVSLSGGSWNLTINESGEFDSTEESSTNTINLWIYATDEAYNQSASVECTVEIDNNIPIFVQDSLYLVQYDDGDGTACTDGSVSSGDTVVSQKYTEDMSISGVWYLIGNITDESGISEIRKDGSIVADSDTTSEEFTAYTDSETGVTNYKMNIPVGDSTTDSVGTTEISIKATDNNTNSTSSSTKEFTIYYDNKPPELSTDDDYYISSTVQNSNGFYSLSGIANEDSVDGTNQTGVKRIAFYFTRNLSYTEETYDADTDTTTTEDITVSNIYDVMLDSDSSAIEYTSGDSYNSGDYTISYCADDGLYWKTHSSITVSGSALTLSTEDENIHEGGLVKVNGVIYRIDGVSDDGLTITLDSEPGDATTAYFAVAQVVDNFTAEGSGSTKNDAGYYTDATYDDGDLMIESIIKQSTTYYWEANINSTNISDGPVVIHYVVFDEAGNSNVETIDDAFIKNNQPRIVGVSVGTDENGDGSVTDSDDNEYVSMSGLYENGYYDSGSKVTNATFPIQNGTEATSLLSIKGKTVIKPETVGGNGVIKYNYTVSTYDSGLVWNDPYYEVDGVESLGSGSTDDTVLTSEIDFDVADFLSADDTGTGDEIVDANLQKFSFKLWDSTPGTTSGTDSQYVTMNIIMDVAIRDATAATNVIIPFYWNDSDDNSLYENSTDNGHIELPEDLPETIFIDASGEYDTDPKVSGQIVIEGIAHDNTLLSGLTASIETFKSGADLTIATYDSGAWTSGSELTAFDTNGWACEITQATYSEYEAANLGDIPSDKTGDDLVDYASQDTGHTVHWKLYFDSSKITNVADTDIAISVEATDQGTPDLDDDGTTVNYTSNTFVPITGQTGEVDTSTDEDTDADDYTSKYQIDVVPYITAIHTTNRSDSGLKDNNIRSASGKYSVLYDSSATDTDFITASGFNLEDSDVYITNSTDVLTETLTDAGIDATATSSSEISFSNNISNSGYLDVYTNGIRTLNNINDNSAAGSYTITGTNSTDYQQMYNREPDVYETKNIQLTDDRYLRMFDMKDTGIANGYYPNMLMDGDNPVFGYVDLNGVNSLSSFSTSYSTSYMPQRAYYDVAQKKVTDIEYLIGASNWSGMGMAEDDNGDYYHVTVYDRSGGHMAFIYDSFAEDEGDGWGDGIGYSGYSGDWCQYENNNAIALESVDYGNGTFIGRYQNPQMVVTGNANSTAQVYMAYYDANTTNKNIIFRDFRVGTSSMTNTLNYDTTDYVTRYSNLSEENTSGRQTAVSSASKYFAMVVASDSTVIIVYYDQSAGKLKLAYSTSPVDGSAPTTNQGWTTSSLLNFPDYVGQYVSMTIDSSDNLHIAAYDANDGDLRYMRVEDYKTATAPSFDCTVDQAGSVGNWTQIKLNSSDIPYIAYYNSTETGSHDAIKLAYANSATVTEGGVDDNDYTTGAWEYMTVPSITAAQGGSDKFKQVNLGFDSKGKPVVGYLGTNIEFGKWLDETD
ncbi:MAG: hypothetical protein BKP49_07060 [Treponema sp. CETP13]|nr:MAG: hypothetical protein BKP49_07060 [Treponema sp. CETP13]